MAHLCVVDIMNSARPAKLYIAPMMALTDRHCRFLHRMFSPKAILFTEMVTAHALIFGERTHFLNDRSESHPVVFQIGGSDADSLCVATEIISSAGYPEVNLNVGCPSDRVKNGRFGACLMAEPDLVADAVKQMCKIGLPVSVKCRLGIDDLDTQPLLERFVDKVANAGCERFYVHARKAILGGLSPAQNRTIPPLQYDRVYALKARFPQLEIIINGGITSALALAPHLANTDGVMIGRAAYYQPEAISEIAAVMFGDPIPDRTSIIDDYIAYMKEELNTGVSMHHMSRHLLGLYSGVSGVRQFRRTLSDQRRLRHNDIGLVHEALGHIREAA